MVLGRDRPRVAVGLLRRQPHIPEPDRIGVGFQVVHLAEDHLRRLGATQIDRVGDEPRIDVARAKDVQQERDIDLRPGNAVLAVLPEIR